MYMPRCLHGTGVFAVVKELLVMTERKEMAWETLSEEDLLSEFIPEESAKILLREYASLYNILLHTSEQRIGAVQGVGSTRLKKLLCIREVMHRIQQEGERRITAINSPRDAMELFAFLRDCQQEEFWAVLLNMKNAVIKKMMITKGTLNASLAAPREVFHAAVQCMAAGVIIVHNHPSGDSLPSKEDKAVTMRMIQAGRLLDINLLDHVIIGKSNSRSLSEEYPELWNDDSIYHNLKA